MKIAFWSNVRGSGGVSTNMICMAAVAAISGMGRGMLLENHSSIRGLGTMLLSDENNPALRETGQYYNKYGIEYVLKRLYTGESGVRLIREASVPLLYSSIYYLPQSYIVNKEVFNYEFELAHKDLFRCLESVVDLVFVDTEANRNSSTIQILEDADLIVVNLPQDAAAWDDFFENYAALAEKSMFLVGRYQREYRFNQLQIRRKYHIPKSRIGVMPYNMEMEEATQEGRLLQFLNRSYLRAGNAENEYLMREMKRSAVILKNHAQGKTGGQGEIKMCSS